MTDESIPIDRQKQPIDLAISCGRSYQSGQTGLIHYCYKCFDEEPDETIPLLENFLFALALLRGRTAESMAEAKTLIGRLLYFQSKEGNFPVYLHDYPQCRDRYLAAHLLAPCYWMLKDYRKLLGGELAERLEIATELLFCYSLKTVEHDDSSPYVVSLKIAAAAVAFGKLWNKQEWIVKGESLLNQLLQLGAVTQWYSPAHLGDLLVGLQMVYPSLPNSPWKALWDHISATWHRASRSYAGPGLQERQRQHEPQVTLYDYIMGHYAGHYSYRAFALHPNQLQAALIQPSEDLLPDLTYPVRHHGVVEGRSWGIVQTERFAYSYIQQLQPENPSQEYRVHPFRLVWGDRNCSHSFVCQDGNAEQIDFEPLFDDELCIRFSLPQPSEKAERDTERDISFFIDQHDALKKRVGSLSATTFQLRDEVKLADGMVEIDLTFEAEKGGVKFFGHLMPGNRPSQMSIKGANRFKAFDEQIFLRAVDRKEPCKVTVWLRMA